MYVIKANGSKEEFSKNKLLSFLTRVGANKDQAESISHSIQNSLVDGVTTSTIYEQAYHALKAQNIFHPPRISIKHAVSMLGPTGFPFERYISKLFELQGYRVLLDQHIKGGCVEHEVDVVAFDEKDLIVCEVKFHNELGIKSDLKVALYVKARFDDLQERPIDILGVPRTMTQGILITNTKFTLSALEYASCKGLSLIGWNTPVGHGLEFLILKHKMHPITLLSSLSHIQKQQLIAQGIILIRDIMEKPSDMATILSLSDLDLQLILDECQSLFSVNNV